MVQNLVALTLQDIGENALLRRNVKTFQGESVPDIIVEEYERRGSEIIKKTSKPVKETSNLDRKISETKSEGKLRTDSVTSRESAGRRRARFKRRSKSD